MNYKILTLVVALVTFIFIGCSKDDNGDPKKGVVKVTISTSETFSAVDGNSVDLSVGAFNSAGDFLDMKINGEISSGVKVLHRKHDSDFNGGKTYVFETVGDYTQVQINVAAFCIAGPFVLKYKIEQGDKVVEDKDLSFNEESDVYTEAYVIK